MKAKLNELIQVYVNEKSTKKLLPYSQIADYFNELIKSANESTNDTKIVLALKELELQRLKYFVKEYILERLKKIKSNIFLSDTFMSNKEREFYRKYITLLKDQNVLTAGPSDNVEYVGFYCINALKNIKIDGEVVELAEGDFLVANVNDIIDYVVSGHIILV